MKKKKKKNPKPAEKPIAGKPIEAVTEPCRRPGLIPLSEREPEIALEWYYPSNCGFGPEDFSYGSQVNAFWQCSKDRTHIWRVRILTRCVQKRGCPYCLGTNLSVPVPYERSLACVDPALAKEWHSKKNGDLKPENVLPYSKQVVFWQCQNDRKHSYELDISRRRTDGQGCTICYKESLHTLDKYPEALKYYDLKKNLGLKPDKVTLRSVVWWRCPAAPDHSWLAIFRTVMRCRFCSKRKASSTSSLLSVYPKLAVQVHPTRNGKLTADKIAAHGDDYIWWRCSYNPRHIWQASVINRTMNGSGCPDCWKDRRPAYFKRLAAERKAKTDQVS
jgi:hypothetical protein